MYTCKELKLSYNQMVNRVCKLHKHKLSKQASNEYHFTEVIVY